MVPSENAVDNALEAGEGNGDAADLAMPCQG